MSSELIKKHLEELKSQKKFDASFIDILVEANETSEDGEKMRVFNRAFSFSA